MPHTSDIEHTPGDDVPFLAKMLYHEYVFSALQLADEAIGKTIEFLPELFPTIPPDVRNEFRRILELERVVKFCHIAENLGAIAVAFKSSFEDENAEILGIYDAITTYDVGQVMDFYKHIHHRDLQYVAQFVGYPILAMQNPGARNTLEMSCRNIRDDLAKISPLYDELRPLYYAYKHGYRIGFGFDNKTHEDVIVYVDIKKRQRVLNLTADLKKQLREKVALAFHIMNVIFEAHRTRVNFEATGATEGPLKVTIYRRKTDPKPSQQDVNLIYQTRGERLRKVIEESDRVYELFRKELEQNHKGKFVAIDIDEKKIIGIDQTLAGLRSQIESKATTGRIRVRRVGKDERTGLDLY